MTREARREVLLAKLKAGNLDASGQRDLASILARKRGRPVGAIDPAEKYFPMRAKRQRGCPKGGRDGKEFAWGAMFLECAEKLICEFNTLTDEQLRLRGNDAAFYLANRSRMDSSAIALHYIFGGNVSTATAKKYLANGKRQIRMWESSKEKK